MIHADDPPRLLRPHEDVDLISLTLWSSLEKLDSVHLEETITGPDDVQFRYDVNDIAVDTSATQVPPAIKGGVLASSLLAVLRSISSPTTTDTRS